MFFIWAGSKRTELILLRFQHDFFAARCTPAPPPGFPDARKHLHRLNDELMRIMGVGRAPFSFPGQLTFGKCLQNKNFPAADLLLACRLLWLFPSANEAFGIVDNDVDLCLVKPQYSVGLSRESRTARPVEKKKGSGRGIQIAIERPGTAAQVEIVQINHPHLGVAIGP